MPWKELSVSDQRWVLVHQVVELKRPVSVVARECGVSRKTAYKWCRRFQQDRNDLLRDRSRRPKSSPQRSEASIEQSVLALRHKHNWGPRKIHRLLKEHLAMPSIRTVATILVRHGCVGPTTPPPEPPPLQCFQRGAPNELWQLDHKGPIEVGRERYTPLSILDDHSRYCLCFTPLIDVTLVRAWNLLWEVFKEVGMPQAILCDNAFSGSIGLSWFDVRLVRLGIRPIHGRAYHPQTQGKVERFHGSAKRELINFNARRDTLEHFQEDAARWRQTYNTIRPHEAIGDVPPMTRWKPSSRPRPDTLPEVSYPPDAILRRVSHAGDFRYQNARIVVGRALHGQTVRIEERDHDIGVYYSWKQVRVIPHALLGGRRSHKII
jgi:transposase InsO family protein